MTTATETVSSPAVESAAPLAPAAEHSPRPLTTQDRCDLCGAQAYVRVVLHSGELVFCGHHARAQGEKLREAALLYQDETAELMA